MVSDRARCLTTQEFKPARRPSKSKYILFKWLIFKWLLLKRLLFKWCLTELDVQTNPNDCCFTGVYQNLMSKQTQMVVV